MGRLLYKYVAKLFAQKLLGAFPGGYRMQEWVKHKNRPAPARVPSSALAGRIKSRIGLYKAHSIEPPKTVVEHGTGWQCADAIGFYLAGAERVDSFDTRKWLVASEVNRTAQALLEDLSVFEGWASSQTVHERAEPLKRLLKDGRPVNLTELGIHYHISENFEHSAVPSDSVDFFFSYSVLQRMTTSDLQTLIETSRRVLRKEARAFHRIHTQDFHQITDSSIPPLYYLRVPEYLWRLSTSKYLNYQNRLRARDFDDLFRRSGFERTTDNVEWRTEDVSYARTHLLSIYPEFSAEEIATWQTDFILALATDPHPRK